MDRNISVAVTADLRCWISSGRLPFPGVKVKAVIQGQPAHHSSLINRGQERLTNQVTVDMSFETYEPRRQASLSYDNCQGLSRRVQVGDTYLNGMPSPTAM